jgi:hypothetical protein
LAVTSELTFEPTRRGKRVGCREATYTVRPAADRLTKAQVATVKSQLTPIPAADLVPRPDFTVSVKGVRMIYFPVRGTGARQLNEAWASTSSQKKYCGTIKYSWHTGSRRTSSCIKSSWDPDFTYDADPYTGSCTVTGFDLNMRMSMPIARWTGPSLVPRGLVTWWKETQRYVRDHEAGHVAIYREWIPKLRGRVLGAKCAEITAIFKKWSGQVQAAQEAFDRREYARTDWPAYPPDAR